jgi:hypothetical protein
MNLRPQTCLILGCLLASLSPCRGAAYTNTIPFGQSLIVNQLDHGSNTADVLFPNPYGLHDGDELMCNYNCANGALTTVIFDSSSASGFDDTNGLPLAAAPALPPGAGFFYLNYNGTYSLAFTGTAHVPTLPPTNLYCGYNSTYLLGRQTNDVGNYTNITGLTPTPGAQFATWNGASYVTNLFTNGTWTLGEPSLPVGQAAQIFIPGATTASYAIAIQAGLNLIANQLDNGSNTLDEVLPSVPDGSVLYKYNNSGGNWSSAYYSAASASWLPSGASFFESPTNFKFTFSPGEAAFFQAPTNFTLTFTGVPHVPALPVSIPSGALYLLSRQTNDVGDYTNIVGLPPTDGTTVYEWTGSSYSTFTYAEGAWSPSAPSTAVGQGVWISPGGSTVPPPVPTSYTVAIQAGLNLIANQVQNDSETLNDIMPNVPDGSVLYKYNNASGSWSSASYNAAAGAWTPGNLTLSPGEGAFFQAPTNFWLTLTGVPNVPVLPVSIPNGAVYLLSRQTNDVGDYTNIVGLAPTNGTTVYEWTGSNYNAFVYENGTGVATWSPSEPVAAVGEAVWIAPNGGSPPFLNTNLMQSLVYQGLTNTSLGHASLALSGSSEVISNLGSGGQDGVSIAWPSYGSALTVSVQPFDISNTAPVGAFIQQQVVGSANGSNGVLGSVAVTKLGTTNYAVTADFLPLGTSNCLVQAYLQGTLVGQATNNSGPPGIIVRCPDAPWYYDADVEYDLLGPTFTYGNPYITAWTTGWPTGTEISISQGQTILSDHVFITPIGAPGYTPTAFQLTASEVPAIVINSENASLVYQGLTNTSLGHASIALSGSSEVISNLGSSGQDGVTITLSAGNNSAISLLPWDPTNALPTGAYLQSQLIGTAGSITNGVLGTTTCTKQGTSNYVISVDYSPLGASQCVVQVYNGATLVTSVPGQNGGVASVSLPPWVCTINPDLNNEWTKTVPITLSSGTTVMGTELRFVPRGGNSISAVTADQIVAANIPSLTITNEVASVNYDGLQVSTLGDTTLSVQGTELVATMANGCCVSNLSSGGQDGLAFSLPAGAVFDASWTAFDPSNSLPEGAFLQEQIIGSAGTVINGQLGTVTMTKACATCPCSPLVDPYCNSNYVISGDFSGIGASAYTVQAYLNGTLVAQATNQPGPVLATCGIWGDSGCIPQPTILGGGWDWTNDPAPYVTIGTGSPVQCDHLYVIAENVTGTPSVFQLTASQVPGITLTSAGAGQSLVYQGLTNTSLGHASLTVSGSQLVVSNLTSGGQDGVTVTLPPGAVGMAFSCPPAGGSNPPPVGTFFQGQVVGLASGSANVVLGTATVTYSGSNTYSLAADYSPLGASNYTVEAYSHGILVGQSSGGSGEVFATGEDPPNTLDVRWVGTVPVISHSIHWSAATTVTFNAGGGVTCDEVIISPQNPVSSGPPTAFQIVAAGVSSFTLDSENASFVYQGLTNTSVHHASVAMVGSSEVISNLGSSGQDGLSISLPSYLTGLVVSTEPLDPSNSLPDGAYIQEQLVGTANGITNGVLATATVTKAGTSNYVIAADFSAMGASSYTAQAYYEGDFVAQVSAKNGASAAQANQMSPREDFENNQMTVGWAPGGCLLTIGGAVVNCDQLYLTPQGGTTGGSPSAFNLVAAGVSSFTLDSENASFVYQGLTNTSLGHASITAVGSSEVISNLGSSGQDGVSFSLPEGAVFDASWTAFDPSNSLPAGAYLQEQIIGTAGTVTDGPLGTVTMTKVCGDCPCPPHVYCDSFNVTADFSNLEISNYTVQAYLNGTLVAQATNQPGPVLATCGIWGDSGCIPQPTRLGGGWDWTNDPAPYVTIGTGSPVQCDHLYVIAENVTGTPSAFQITASQVPGITINSATAAQSLVYQGLTNTSLGHASITAVGSSEVISNLGSSGQDGVSFALASNYSAFGTQWLPIDPSNSLPVGAYVQALILGTGNGVTNGVLGTITVRKAGANDYLVSADFSADGVSNYTAQAYSSGALVAQATNLDGSSLAEISAMPLSLDIYWLPGNIVIPILDWNYAPFPNFNFRGIQVTGDHLDISPQNMSLIGAPTGLEIVASGVPALTMTGATVSPLPLNSSISGGNLTFQWIGSGVLQSSSDLQHWSPVSGATSPYMVQMNGTVRFYRLAQPPIR